jgi:methylmalonyl-CoA/ethylmalonyl-CoA epimerase
MAATRIHHINFVVRDLGAAVRAFERLLGLEPFETVEHAPRGATIARSKVGDSWIMLVCPHDPDSVPGRFLAEHGEGFFLLSVGSNDLRADLVRLMHAGIEPRDRQPRQGLFGWPVADIAEAYGAVLHLTDDGNTPADP